MRLPPWLWHFLASKRTHRALILAPFALMILATIAYVAADKWGKAKFEKQIAALKAEGIPVTLEEAYGPPPAPDDDVFQHPAMVAEMARPETEKLGKIPYMGIEGISKPAKYSKIDSDFAKPLDIRQWSTDPARHSQPDAQLAREWLVTLQPYAARLQTIASAFERPAVDWVYDNKFKGPLLLTSLQLTDFSRDLALIQLAAGDGDGACQSLGAISSVECCMITRQPKLVSLLVGNTHHAKAFNVVWQGVAQRKWNDAQLASLQKEFQRPDLQSECAGAVAKELAFGSQHAHTVSPEIRKHFNWKVIGNEFWDALKSKDGKKAREQVGLAWVAYRPPGLNLGAVADYLNHLQHYGYTDRGKPVPQFDYADFLKFQTMQAIPELNGGLANTANSGRILRHAAETGLAYQTRTDLLQCGIALERYRLKYGKHPESLNALVPEFLTEAPKDVCDNQPLRYRTLPDGTPHVWSLWPSGKDEGGMPHSNPNKGNMVWTSGKIPGLTMSVYMR